MRAERASPRPCGTVGGSRSASRSWWPTRWNACCCSATIEAAAALVDEYRCRRSRSTGGPCTWRGPSWTCWPVTTRRPSPRSSGRRRWTTTTRSCGSGWRRSVPPPTCGPAARSRHRTGSSRCWPRVRPSPRAVRASRVLALAARAAADLADADPALDREGAGPRAAGVGRRGGVLRRPPRRVLGAAYGTTFDAELARLRRAEETAAWRAAKDTWAVARRPASRGLRRLAPRRAASRDGSAHGRRAGTSRRRTSPPSTMSR